MNFDLKGELSLKGAILNKGEEFYTFMSRVFYAIQNAQINYNWLITDIEANPYDLEIEERLDVNYVWITGEELTDMIKKEDFQWIWAVFSGFPHNIMQEDVMKYSLPYVQENNVHWTNPISIQHPLAEVEIVPWDSSLVVIISKNDALIETFMASLRLAMDLEEYNNKFKFPRFITPSSR